MSIAASEGLSLSGYDDSAALSPSGVVALSEPDPEMTAIPGPPRMSGSCGILHRVPILRACMTGFLVEVALVLSAPLRCHSSRKCMSSLQVRGRHLSLPETNLGAPPPLPPSMVEPLWGTRASPRWSGLWPCNCVQQPLPLCGVIRVSPYGPVCTRQV